MKARRRPSGDQCGSLTDFSDAVSWTAGPAAQRQDEQLAGIGRLLGVGDEPLTGIESVLTGSVETEDSFDGQRIGRGDGGRFSGQRGHDLDISQRPALRHREIAVLTAATEPEVD